MIRCFFTALLALAFLQTTGQAQAWSSGVQLVFDSLLHTMEVESLHSKDVDWDQLKVDAYQAIENATDKNITEYQDLSPGIEHAFNTLRDHHARVMMDQTPIAYFTDWENSRSDDERPRDPKAARSIGYAEYPAVAQMVGEEIAYLRVPTVSPFVDPQGVAERLRRMLDSLAYLGAKAWIIDLRYNGGGNIFPMATGIAPLFPEGEYGSTVDADGERVGTWRMKDGTFDRDGYRPAVLQKGNPAMKSARVAVLQGRYTVSSGEILSVGFRGRDKTRLFGEASGGYTTETNWLRFRDGILASFAISRYADKHGRVYDQDVPIDELVESFVLHSGDTQSLQQDEAVQAALAWLRQQRKKDAEE